MDAFGHFVIHRTKLKCVALVGIFVVMELTEH